MKIHYPIITSMLDDDFYKITMANVAFHLFPKANVTYKFFNRGKTQFPEGFADELQSQVNMMSTLALTASEAEWLKNIPFMRPTFVEWFAGYRYNPSEVVITQVGGALNVTVTGPWYRTIFWEVKLMAIISELYYIMMGIHPTEGWSDKIRNKAKKLSDAKCHWIDFGTRRRFSGVVQDCVVSEMRTWDGFLGTSNPHLAHKYGITAHGTYAHESVMAMSALYGVRMANKMWMKHWSDHYEGNVGVALTDTYTTTSFLQDFGTYEARLFDGVRHDSSDPMAWGKRILEHYKKLGIAATNKRLVFSDALTDEKYIALDQYFRQYAQPVGGIGTFLTNDVGTKPMNMVIKMVKADFGRGNVNVVKLSDDEGKHTGESNAVLAAMREANVCDC